MPGLPSSPLVKQTPSPSGPQSHTVPSRFKTTTDPEPAVAAVTSVIPGTCCGVGVPSVQPKTPSPKVPGQLSPHTQMVPSDSTATLVCPPLITPPVETDLAL